MKATADDQIRLMKDVGSEVSDRIIPHGTEGFVLEAHTDPSEAYTVELNLPDDSLVGGYDHEIIVLPPEQFDVLERGSQQPELPKRSQPPTWPLEPPDA